MPISIAPPLAATLPISEANVTNLTTDLAAKVDVAGDTMTGALIVDTDTPDPTTASVVSILSSASTALTITDNTAAASLLNVNVSNGGTADVDTGLQLNSRGTGHSLIVANAGDFASYFQVYTGASLDWQPDPALTDATTTLNIFDKSGNQIIETTAGARLGFYNAAPVAQQTGVAVDVAAIHAALVNLGLITA